MAGLLQNKPLLCYNIPWVEALRQKGRRAFEEQGLPTAKTEYWQYTKPREYMGCKVPDVLLNGNHKLIEEYHIEQKILRTKFKRPDLYEKFIQRNKLPE